MEPPPDTHEDILPLQSDELIPMKYDVSKKAAEYHQRVPGLRKLPLPVFGIILAIVAVNIVVWVVVGIVLVSVLISVVIGELPAIVRKTRWLIIRASSRALVSTAVLAYALGLRHALDADHISAIDLTTRRLVAAGQRPVSVGMFFSLGHSTIVVITSIVVAATAAAVRDKFDRYSHIGGVIGSSVSAGFLIILGIMNMFILYKLVKQLKKLLVTHASHHNEFKITEAGCLYYVFQKLFKLIDRPWKMYPLGVMFGLGFDTSSEVALLGISSIQAAKGTSIWLILIFPILFTAGMCLLDTADGALMMTLYTSTALARDQIAILYYSIVLTIITIVVAIVIGVMQLLSLILNVAEPEGRFWDGVAAAEEYYDVIGGAICASFIFFGGISIVLYKPWRRFVDRERRNTDDLQDQTSLERDALLGEAEPREGYEECFEEDISLRRPESEGSQST